MSPVSHGRSWRNWGREPMFGSRTAIGSSLMSVSMRACDPRSLPSCGRAAVSWDARGRRRLGSTLPASPMFAHGHRRGSESTRLKGRREDERGGCGVRLSLWDRKRAGRAEPTPGTLGSSFSSAYPLRGDFPGSRPASAAAERSNRPASSPLRATVQLGLRGAAPRRRADSRRARSATHRLEQATRSGS
jgi:hypothetical protein